MHNTQMTTAAILGCAGYVGQETLDRVLANPELEPVALGSDSLAGGAASALDLRLDGDLPPFVSNREAIAADAELVFLCLGHEEAASLQLPRDGVCVRHPAPPFLCLGHEEAASVQLPSDAVVVDLSGAHRLRQPALYPEWYGFEHPRPESLGAWSYALPELFPPDGPLIANPGCYATAALLAAAR